jgi:hypothetical protein
MDVQAVKGQATTPVCARPGCGKPLPATAIAHNDPYCSRGCARFEWVSGPALREALAAATQDVKLPDVNTAYRSTSQAIVDAYSRVLTAAVDKARIEMAGAVDEMLATIRKARTAAVNESDAALAAALKEMRARLDDMLGVLPADKREDDGP